MNNDKNISGEVSKEINKTLINGFHHYSRDITIVLRIINYGVITYIFIDNRFPNSELPLILILSAISSLIALIADFFQSVFALWEHKYCLHYHEHNPNKSEKPFRIDCFSTNLRYISDFLFKVKIIVTSVTLLLFIFYIYSKIT